MKEIYGLSSKLINTEKTHYGIIYTFERRYFVDTPIRKNDICIELFYVYEKYKN